MSNFPIGAKWKADDGKKEGVIWLADVYSNGREIWRWASCYSDGSGHKFDWSSSYANCKNEIDVYARFKRVKKD